MRPMKVVPFHWMKKRTVRMTTVIGTISGVSCGASSFKPSTALSTEIAGVIAPSP